MGDHYLGFPKYNRRVIPFISNAFEIELSLMIDVE